MTEDVRIPVVPTPQHARITGELVPVGQVVLPEDADEWALTILRDGLAERGIEIAASSPVGPQTIVRFSNDVGGALAGIADRLDDSLSADQIGGEGYMLTVDAEGGDTVVTIAAANGAGHSFGADTFLQLISGHGADARLLPAAIADWPAVGMRVYGGQKGVDFAARQRFNIVRGGAKPEEIAEMRLRHLESWGGVHPSHATATQPGLRYSDPVAVEEAIRPLLEAAERGVRWHSLSFDDIDLKLAWPEDVEKFGTIGAAHVDFINGTLARLKDVNQDAELIVIPIIYANGWLGGTWVYAVDEDEIYDYVTTIGENVDPSVVFVWTGENVESMSMTDEDLHQWNGLVKRKPLVFENTPTGDVTDYGPLRNRTPNVGDLTEGWIYIHRGPHAEIAEFSTAEYLWNPVAYDPEAAYERALHHIAGDQADTLRKLVDAFRDQGGPRYRHPIWREGRLLEVVDPTDADVADFYVKRLQVISETLPILNQHLEDSSFYQALRNRALESVDVARAYLETYVMLRSIEHGEIRGAIEAGDRAEAVYQDWTRYCTGSTDLNADTDRRDALTYIEQVGVAGKLRALRRGAEGQIAWVRPESNATRLGRPCRVLAEVGDSAEVSVFVKGADLWLVITASGPAGAPVSVTLDGQPLELAGSTWTPDAWRTHAIRVDAAAGEHRVRFAAEGTTEWALARVALLESPAPERVLHATKSTAQLGEVEVLSSPKRHVMEAATGAVNGHVAVRQDIAVIRPVSGRFYDLAPETRIGQTFHVTSPGEKQLPPKDAIKLHIRESEDCDHLFGIGMQFQQAGTTPLTLTLWRWAGSVTLTTGSPGNRVASAAGTMNGPHGASRHVCFFPIGDGAGVELDLGATYYFEVSAPEGWDGWRVRRAFGWYGERSDPERSGYVDGKLDPGADSPFRTYALDVYSANWRKK